MHTGYLRGSPAFLRQWITGRKAAIDSTVAQVLTHN